MRILRVAVNFLLALLFMMLLVVNELSFVTSSTLLNSQYYTKTLTQVGYYDHLETEINLGLTHIGLATGLPPEVFVNFIDRPWLERQGTQYITSLIDYLSLTSDTVRFDFDSKPLETKLNQTIVNYALQKGLPVAQEDLTMMKALLVKNVQQRILVVDPQNPLVLSVRNVIAPLLMARIYILFASLFILLCLFLVNRKELSQFFQWLAYSFLATGLFIVIPSGLLLSSSVLDRLALQDLTLRQAVGAILDGFVSVTLYAGLATIIVGILLVFATSKLTHAKEDKVS